MIERDADLLKRYSADVSGMSQLPSGVVRPRDVKDVIDAVHEAAGQGKTLLPIGAQTSTTGASVATDGGLVLDLNRLTDPPELSADQTHVHVSPGMKLGQLHAWLHIRDLELPVDPTSSADCTVGGAIATNASGPSTFRFGAMDQWVAAVDFIDGQGNRQHAARRKVDKSAMGPAALADPVRLIVGSEGIFGAIVTAQLRVIPRPVEQLSVVVGFDSQAALFNAIPKLRQVAAEQGIRAIEWLDATCVELLANHPSSRLLPETSGGCLYIALQSQQGRLLERVEQLVATAQPDVQLAQRAVVLSDAASLRAFAALRHCVPETLNARGRQLRLEGGGGKLSTDWSVPVDRLREVFAWTQGRFAKLQLDGLYAYGHVGNGHPHLNLLCADETTRLRATVALKEQLQLIAKVGGVAVSEHGIGKLKRDLVSPYIPPATRAAILALKAHFDPNGIFAPGNIITV